MLPHITWRCRYPHAGRGGYDYLRNNPQPIGSYVYRCNAHASLNRPTHVTPDLLGQLHEHRHSKEEDNHPKNGGDMADVASVAEVPFVVCVHVQILWVTNHTTVVQAHVACCVQDRKERAEPNEHQRQPLL